MLQKMGRRSPPTSPTIQRWRSKITLSKEQACPKKTLRDRKDGKTNRVGGPTAILSQKSENKGKQVGRKDEDFPRGSYFASLRKELRLLTLAELNIIVKVDKASKIDLADSLRAWKRCVKKWFRRSEKAARRTSLPALGQWRFWRELQQEMWNQGGFYVQLCL